jgi:hypothetical protein
MAESGDNREYHLTLVDVERRGYGRRYTSLPVDTLNDQGFSINCTDTYMRPALYDLRQGDMVRWLHNGHYHQGTIATIERTETLVQVTLKETGPLPEDFFPA